MTPHIGADCVDNMATTFQYTCGADAFERNMPALGQLRVIADAYPAETAAVFAFSPDAEEASKTISREELLTATRTLRDAILANPELTPAAVWIESPWPGSGEYSRCNGLGSFYMPGQEGLFSLDASSGTECILTHYVQNNLDETGVENPFEPEYVARFKVLSTRDVSHESTIRRVGLDRAVEEIRIIRKPRKSTIVPFLKQLDSFLDSCDSEVVQVEMA